MVSTSAILSQTTCMKIATIKPAFKTMKSRTRPQRMPPLDVKDNRPRKRMNSVRTEESKFCNKSLEDVVDLLQMTSLSPLTISRKMRK